MNSKSYAPTSEQTKDLFGGSIGDKFHHRSLEEYPEVMEWFDSEDGKSFIGGKKDLLLVGEWKAVQIGILMQRWFILVNGHDGGFVTDLEELATLLLNDDREFYDSRLDAKSIFIEGFNTEQECGISAKERDRVVRFVKNRHNSNAYSTILHIPYSPLSWYPKYFRSFVMKNFVTLDSGDHD